MPPLDVTFKSNVLCFLALCILAAALRLPTNSAPISVKLAAVDLRIQAGPRDLTVEINKGKLSLFLSHLLFCSPYQNGLGPSAEPKAPKLRFDFRAEI